MKADLVKKISVNGGTEKFQIRFDKLSGIGLLSTVQGGNYVLLGSLECWYQISQHFYPRKKICACKSQYFYIKLKRKNRTARKINIITTCTSCDRISQNLYTTILHQSADYFFERPTLLCGKPKIKYKYDQLTSYWSKGDLKRFIKFIFEELHLSVTCCYLYLPEKTRRIENISFFNAIDIIDNHRFLAFYFSENELALEDHILSNIDTEDGVSFKQEIWQQHEIIKLSEPLYIQGCGLAYFIEFSHHRFDGGVLKSKSNKFKGVTRKMKTWLSENFSTARGSKCYDGVDLFNQLTKSI